MYIFRLGTPTVRHVASYSSSNQDGQVFPNQLTEKVITAIQALSEEIVAVASANGQLSILKVTGNDPRRCFRPF